MRVSPPAGLRQSADALLADVRDRLAARLPAHAESEADPTDPGWILLEQAAWMVEQLTTQLEEYPLAIVQQFLHMMGARVLPARPALGVVTAQIQRDGVLDWDPARPSPLRLFTTQTERADMVEFVPVERGVSLRGMRLASMAEIRDGELLRPAAAAEEGATLWRSPLVPSTAFRGEQVRYRLVAANPTELEAQLRTAIDRVAEHRIGWLRLSVEDKDARGLTLVAWIDPAEAFAASAPAGLTPHGDLVGDWGTLDDSTWTPAIRVADHAAIPAWLRGRAPLPAGEGRVVLPAMAANLPLESLLLARAAPVPSSVCVAIWNTLTHAETRLAAYRPVLQRVYAAPEPEEPAWLGGVIDSELWYRLAPGPVTLVHVELAEVAAATVRLGLVLGQEDPAALPEIRVYPQERSGLVPDVPLPHRVAFRLPCPAAEAGRGMELVVALDVDVPAGTTGLLVSVAGSCRGALANPLLVVQAPAVRDGREVSVERHVPEGVSLLHGDVVGPDVLADLVDEPLPEDVRALLRALPLAWFDVPRQEPILDFAGIALDPVSGEIVLNGVDRRGDQRPLRRGDRVELRWYRRTDGEHGNVAAGAIQLVEQDADAGPLFARVENPLATFYGTAREDDRTAIDRLFGPSDAVPVLPSDFERLIRHALGTRGATWDVRCWSYAERALVTTDLWPPPALGQPTDPERARLAEELAGAGPEKLLVLVGPRSGEMTAADLDWARRAVRGLCARIGRRVPTVRDAVVGRLWPLTLEHDGEPPAVPLPCYAVEGLGGTLVDAVGRRAPPPRALLLNAAVTGLRGPAGRAR